MSPLTDLYLKKTNNNNKANKTAHINIHLCWGAYYIQ
jgi:hypothetical protein